MWIWLDRIGSVLFDATLSTAIFLSFMVLAMLVCRQPSRRILIARASLLASLAMVPTVAFAPLPRIDVIGTAIRTKLLPAHLIPDWEHSALEWRHARQAADPASGGRELQPSRLSLHASPWLLRSATLLFLTCVSFGIAWLLLGFWGVCWLVRQSREPSPDTIMLYDRLFAGRARADSRPALRVTGRIEHPVVVGLWRPTILIPPAYDASLGDPELLRLSLLHEIAHAQRGDAWFGTVANLAQTLWFFLPQAWWLRSQLVIDQEFIADRRAASRYGTSSSYAASLLALADSREQASGSATHVSGSDPHGPLESAPEARSPLFQRVLMLLYCPFRVEPRAPRSWSWMLKITVALASLLAACLCLRWPDDDAFTQRLKAKRGLVPERFRVTDFVAEPLVFAGGGRAVPYVMPVALPERYELTVEVLARDSDLSKVRIAGYPLGASAATGPNPVRSNSQHGESWHVVQVRCTGEEVALSVDGQSVAVAAEAKRQSRWLTFEPGPDRPAQFRNLVVEW